MSEAVDFIYVTCQVGAEATVKRELARTQPDLHLAYSRPGFLTFKQAGGTGAGVRLNLPFVRTWGNSLGRLQGSALLELANDFWHKSAGLDYQGIHVWERDARMVGQRGFEPALTSAAEEAAALIAAVRPVETSAAPINETATLHQVVLDCVLVGPAEWWLGYHRVETSAARYPGGLFPIPPCPDMISRAYLKMAEALAWSGLPMEPGESCVELGSAPGGASQALLARGLLVQGIDPADMDPRVLAHPNFTHVKMRGADLKRKAFRDVDWLTADVNIVPEALLRTVEAIVTHADVEIRGLLLMLKLQNERQIDRVPDYLESIRSWGYRDVQTWQLAHNRHELCVSAQRPPARRARPKRKSLHERRTTS